jgi:hypothetical protein
MCCKWGGGLSGLRTRRIIKYFVGPFGLDSFRLTEGPVLKDMGVNSIIIVMERGDHRVDGTPRQVIDVTESYPLNMKLGQFQSQIRRLEEE